MCSLTYELINEKSKGKQVDDIKKLNCWASNLNDVSILKELKKLEVLTLSVNKIETLKDIQHCKNLTELYIRNNNISNLDEIFYLKELKSLKILWLADNACSKDHLYDSIYRLTVIRNLPNLQKLDNSNVTQDEIISAQISGRVIENPPEEKGNQASDSLTYEKILPINSEENNSEIPNTEKVDNGSLNGTDFEEKNNFQDKKLTNGVTNENNFEDDTEENDNFEATNLRSTNGGQSNQSSNALQAILLLINDLNGEEVQSVMEACENRKEGLRESTIYD